MTNCKGHSLPENFYQVLFDASSDAMLLIDDQKIIDCNLSAHQMLKLADNPSIKPAPLSDFSPVNQPCGKTSLEKAEEMLELVYQNGNHRFAWSLEDSEGNNFLVELMLTVIGSNDKNLVHVVLRDISHQALKYNGLGIAGPLFLGTSDAIMITDSNNEIIEVNPSFEKITGYTSDEVIGKPAGFMKSGRHDKYFYKRLWQQLSNSGFWEGEIWDYHKKGYLIQKNVKITAIKSNHASPIYLAVFSDTSEKMAHERALEKLAYYDGLTNYPNRELLLKKLEKKIQRVRSLLPRQFFYTAFIDIDDFKIFNDVHGHLFGDDIIKNVINRLGSKLGSLDVIGRMSGDEYLIIFDVSHNVETINQTLKEMFLSMANPFYIEREEYYIKLSIGLSKFPDDGINVRSIISNADIAMYQAKSKGGNQFVFYNNHLGDRFHQLNKIELQLADAIRNNKIYPHFQPQFDLQSGSIIGVEVLARWEIEEGKFIAPDVFIPLAEKSHLIKTLTKNLLTKSIHSLRKFFIEQSLTLSINVSAVEISCKGFAEGFTNIIILQGFEPKQIEIEITESCLVENFEGVSENITALRKQGVKIAIDDFGTGFSSYDYLRKLTVDTIKLDKSFIQGVSKGNKNESILIKSIINLAHQLGLKVVAEGIETEIHSIMLNELNCDYAQGYYFSHPLNIIELRIKYLENINNYQLTS